MDTHVTPHFYMFLERLFYVVFGFNFLQSCILRKFFFIAGQSKRVGSKSVKNFKIHEILKISKKRFNFAQ